MTTALFTTELLRYLVVPFYLTAANFNCSGGSVVQPEDADGTLVPPFFIDFTSTPCWNGTTSACPSWTAYWNGELTTIHRKTETETQRDRYATTTIEPPNEKYNKVTPQKYNRVILRAFEEMIAFSPVDNNMNTVNVMVMVKAARSEQASLCTDATSPFIQKTPKKMYLSVGRTLNLQCMKNLSIDENNKKIYWSVTGAFTTKQLDSNLSHATITELFIISRLSIPDMQLSDTGVYFCSIGAARMFEVEAIVVNSTLQVMEFRQAFAQNVEVNEGDNFTLQLIAQMLLNGSRTDYHLAIYYQYDSIKSGLQEDVAVANRTHIQDRTVRSSASTCEPIMFDYNFTIARCLLTITDYNVTVANGGTWTLYILNSNNLTDVKGQERPISIAIRSKKTEISLRCFATLETTAKFEIKPMGEFLFLKQRSSYMLFCVTRGISEANDTFTLQYFKQTGNFTYHSLKIDDSGSWKNVPEDYYDVTRGEYESGIVWNFDADNLLVYRCIAKRMKTENWEDDVAMQLIIAIPTDVDDREGIGKDIVLWDDENKRIIQTLNSAEPVYAYFGDHIELICRIQKRNFVDLPIPVYAFQWILNGNGNSLPLQNPIRTSPGISLFVKRNDTETLNQLHLQVQVFNLTTISPRISIDVECQSYHYGDVEEQRNVIRSERPVKVFVSSSVPPFFDSEEDYPAPDTTAEFEQQKIFICKPNGDPKPTVNWYRDGNSYENDTISIKISKVSLEHEGVYSCQVDARPRFEPMWKNTTLKVTGAPLDKRTIIIISTVIPLSIILIILAAIICYKHQKQKKLADLYNDLKTSSCYNASFEIAKERLQIDFSDQNVLGTGAFGKVLSAVLLPSPLAPDEPAMLVAVKVPRDGKNPLQQSMFLDEMKVMMTTGIHINVLKMIGACTENMVKGELFVVVELCSMGSVWKYLQENSKFKEEFVNSRSGNNVGYGGTLKEIRVILEESTSNCSETAVILSPANGGTASFTKAKSQIAAKNELFNVLSFALQTANGMDYLGKKLIIHRDLAARNLLLTEKGGFIVVKIADYGLARQREEYRMREGLLPLLPISWMAPESINADLYTSESDVWSFGVVLWEMFTWGDDPYKRYKALIQSSNDSFESKLFLFLQSDQRLMISEPSLASEKMIQLMNNCWEMNPKKRPLFSSCFARIKEEMISTCCSAEKCHQLFEFLHCSIEDEVDGNQLENSDQQQEPLQGEENPVAPQSGASTSTAATTTTTTSSEMNETDL